MQKVPQEETTVAMPIEESKDKESGEPTKPMIPPASITEVNCFLLLFLKGIDTHFCSTQLFMLADSTDILYMSLGTFGAVVTGLCIPTFNILFGRIINTVNSDPSSFQDTVNQLCTILVVVSGINLFSGFFQVQSS